MVKNINKILVINFLIINLLTACHADEDDKSNKINDATKATSDTSLITGIVKETMDAGGYTYINLTVGDESKWIAGPKTEVTVGNTVSVAPPMPMSNFKSVALNREFETIYFTAKILTDTGKMNDPAILNKSETASPHAGMDMNKMAESEKTTTPNDHTSTTNKSDPVKGIKKAKNGKTIDDVLKHKNDLAGKSVKIRGKVIKYTSQVMNKNWIHIKDSSTGDDLTITTYNEAEVGDTIVVDGKIAINKDFGYGYIYHVILEDAKVTIEN